MAFDATLSVAGNDIPIYEFHFGFRQANDNQGRPASGVFTGDIYLILEGGNDLFFEWICDQTRMESGKIKIKRDDQDSTFVEYSFEKAFVTDVSETFIDMSGGQNEFNSVSIMEDDASLYGMMVYNRIRGRDTDAQPLLSAYNTARDFQRRTGTSYCLFFSLSCEKIRVRDIEHNNQWGK